LRCTAQRTERQAYSWGFRGDVALIEIGVATRGDWQANFGRHNYLKNLWK